MAGACGLTGKAMRKAGFVLTREQVTEKRYRYKDLRLSDMIVKDKLGFTGEMIWVPSPWREKKFAQLEAVEANR
jgi:hypothetical protein